MRWDGTERRGGLLLAKKRHKTYVLQILKIRYGQANREIPIRIATARMPPIGQSGCIVLVVLGSGTESVYRWKYATRNRRSLNEQGKIAPLPFVSDLASIRILSAASAVSCFMRRRHQNCWLIDSCEDAKQHSPSHSYMYQPLIRHPKWRHVYVFARRR